MRPLLTPLIALALASCGQEPSFDERYNETAANIEERAADIDQELNSGNATLSQ